MSTTERISWNHQLVPLSPAEIAGQADADRAWLEKYPHSQIRPERSCRTGRCREPALYHASFNRRAQWSGARVTRQVCDHHARMFADRQGLAFPPLQPAAESGGSITL